MKYLVEKNDRLLLPDLVVPKKYVLHITPQLEEFTFTGKVDIHLQVRESTNVIVLHSLECKLERAVITETSNQAINIEYSESEEVVALTFEKPIDVSEHQVLSINYTGIINDKLRGLYRSRYTIDGVDHYMATSQFEATDARRCFPCFDEPALKAVFDISLTVRSDMTALSNMPEKSCDANTTNNTKTVRFMETPVMSTYLVAMIIGDLEYIEGRSKEGVLVRIFKVRGNSECPKFSLKVACDVLSFFNDFFGVPYPLAKCDQIAIPDFALGAMENWGLITYRENYLLTSDKTTTSNKQAIASVIGHEIAHQWFGNLVTMEWWSQLWLNEGFASFMEYVVSHYLFPEWNVWMEFNQDFRGESLILDSLENSHPIEVPVRNSSEISEIFDTISYFKGSCVINMIEDRLGDKFRQGLSNYIKKHSYKNTNTEDLWQSLTDSSGINVKEWVDSFTKISGYPTISFKSTSTPGTFEIKQKRFKNLDSTISDDALWNCFIKVQTDNGLHEFILDKKQSTITIPNYNPNGWLKPNYLQKGYYRMDLDQSIINSLKPLIKSLELPAPDRLGLISDCFFLTKSGDIPISVFLDLLNSYVNETEQGIWKFIIQRFNHLFTLVGDEEQQSKLSKFIIKLLKPLGQKLGFEKKPNESAGDSNLRDIVLAALGQHGDKETIEKSRELFKQYIADASSVDADILKAVLGNVIHNGGEQEQTLVINQFNKSKVTGDKEIILRVLGSVNDTALAKRALEFSLSTAVRAQDTFMVWVGIHEKQAHTVYKFLQDNFESINETFKENGLYYRMISSAFPTRFASREQHDQIKKFFDDHPIPSCERNIKQELETSLSNMEYYKSIKDDLLRWLNSQ